MTGRINLKISFSNFTSTGVDMENLCGFRNGYGRRPVPGSRWWPNDKTMDPVRKPFKVHDTLAIAESNNVSCTYDR